MHRLVTAAAAAFTLAAFVTSPAFADGRTQGNYGQTYNPNGQHQYQQQDQDDDEAYQGQPYQGGQYNGRNRNLDRKFDFNRQEGNFDKWERGWGNQGFGEFRHHRPLSYWRLVNRLEAQGYYGVRGLRKSRFGFGWRAFAFSSRGRPVMLQINPYTGRVLNARYV